MQLIPTNKMRLSILLNVVLLVTATLGYNLRQNEADARLKYEQFKRQYNKAITNEDDDMRFAVFQHNLKRIEQFQRNEEGTAEYDVTQFSDLTGMFSLSDICSPLSQLNPIAEEFAAIYTNARSEEKNQEPIKINIDDLPEPPISVDWRKKGGVGPVLNQGRCGSCWAFSVVGNIEGQWFRKTGNLLTLSTQELVDCDTVDHGCHGGWTPKTYGAIKALGGLMLESNYPYLARAGKCNMDKSRIAAFINDSVVLPANEEIQAAYLAEHGPLSVALNANRLQFYRAGVMRPMKIDCSPRGLNHGVLTVGYGQDRGVPYWLVKNSWGSRWGEQGYFRIYRGDGTCGIERLATSAIIL